MKNFYALLLILAIGAGSGGAQAYQFYNPGLNKYSDTVVQVNDIGNPLVDIPTYSYQAADIVPAATATDVVCLVGSATKTVKLERVQITADAGSASIIDLYVFKRTAANTGGTSTHPAITLLDSSNPAPTAVVNLYSANPSALGAGTLLAGDHYEIPATTGNSYFFGPWIEDFGVRNGQPLILRGTSQQACFSLNGQTLPSGLTVYVRFEWTEE